MGLGTGLWQQLQGWYSTQFKIDNRVLQCEQLLVCVCVCVLPSSHCAIFIFILMFMFLSVSVHAHTYTFSLQYKCVPCMYVHVFLVSLLSSFLLIIATTAAAVVYTAEHCIYFELSLMLIIYSMVYFCQTIKHFNCTHTHTHIAETQRKTFNQLKNKIKREKDK